MICPRCGYSGPESNAACPQCGEGAIAWPPPPSSQASNAPLAEYDPVGEALHLGWRLFLLGAFCAPPVFLPLALWQGLQANRQRPGAGNLLLMLCAGIGALWLALLLLWLLFGK